MQKGLAVRPAPKLVVSEQNRAPLYHQLLLILRSKIFSGEYPDSSYLPSEHELAGMYHVSRITAVRALNELAAQHLVVREKGRGTRVQFVANATIMRGPQLLQPRIRNELTESEAATIRRPSEEVGKVLNASVVPAPAEIAELFGQAPGSPIYRLERLRYFEAVPFSHLVSYLPVEIAKDWHLKDLSTQAIAQLLERDGVHIAELNQRVIATLADDASSERFTIPLGSALLKIVKTAYDPGHVPIEYTVSFYPPERYQYEVTITYATRD